MLRSSDYSYTRTKNTYILSCWFTKLYLPINIVGMDERTKNLFFLAGEENIIEIYHNGKLRYIG
ncbi:DUF6888 family protein [Nostoc sp.]|uniref:DUF6888 family protein n=1 Tax=Nostoc sp. TaxID=1180 RepID=UPI003FA54D69